MYRMRDFTIGLTVIVGVAVTVLVVLMYFFGPSVTIVVSSRHWTNAPIAVVTSSPRTVNSNGSETIRFKVQILKLERRITELEQQQTAVPTPAATPCPNEQNPFYPQGQPEAPTYYPQGHP